MKKILFILVLLVVIRGLNAQTIVGQWNGLLKIQGIELSLVFHIDSTEQGYSATMDSPDQGAKDISVSTVNFIDNTLTLKVAAARIEYVGVLNAAGIVEGTFKQAGQEFPMNLTKEVIKAKGIRRPQEPTKPYPYNAEDVAFKNKKDKLTLAGTFTWPKGKGKHPAVVLISGSGPQNRDEELMGHKPFLVLADYLTRNGYAVLRFDDRGTASSTGDFASATTFDFVNDVHAAVDFLKKRKEVDKSKIGLIGHSEGGIIAPLVTANSNDISFIVLLAGTGIPGHELLLQQQELIGRANGMSEADLSLVKGVNKEIYDLVLQTDNRDSINAKLTAILRNSFDELPSSIVPKELSKEAFVQMQLAQLLAPWMLSFIKYDPALVLEKVSIPVLAINGSKDLQVPAKVNLEAIQNALEKGGNDAVTTKELTGLNHLFQECETGSPNEYAQIEQTISPIALEAIVDWLDSVAE